MNRSAFRLFALGEVHAKPDLLGFTREPFESQSNLSLVARDEHVVQVPKEELWSIGPVALRCAQCWLEG